MGASLSALKVDASKHRGTEIYGNPSILGATDAGVVTARGLTGSLGDAELRAVVAHAGYNWSLGSGVVVGVEVDISLNKDGDAAHRSTREVIPGYSTVYSSNSISHETHFSNLSTLRARFGYVVAEGMMAYVTGGIAHAKVRTTSSLSHELEGSGDPTPRNILFESDRSRYGYALGGGLEYLLAGNVAIKIEGLYFDLGSAKDSTEFTVGQTWGTYYTTGVSASQSFTGTILRLGLNYMF